MNYGGLLVDNDFEYTGSPFKMHKYFDLYTGLEPPTWTGVGSGVIAAKPNHPAIQTWKEFILEYWGYRPIKYGC